MIKLLTFEEAKKLSSRYSRRHLLIGNGFSIACCPDVFVYSRLFEQADFSKLSPSARQAFDLLCTSDFERVIRMLNESAKVGAAYGIPKSTLEQMQKDALDLKELLVQTIAHSHPERPAEISDDEYENCRAFLDNFHTIYSLNYDLLLYWTLMHGENASSDDGFRTSRDDVDAGWESDYVVWEPGQSHSQKTWFLHGALHIFDSGLEVKKYTWSRTGVRLIKQTRDALSKDLFPLFVAEGTSEEKLERIRHSDYLAKAYRSFEGIMYCLFIHGHSLAENDEHFLRVIERGKVEHLFVGLHGDVDSTGNKRIIRRALQMAENRRSERRLVIDFYDSDSANVWKKGPATCAANATAKQANTSKRKTTSA